MVCFKSSILKGQESLLMIVAGNTSSALFKPVINKTALSKASFQLI